MAQSINELSNLLNNLDINNNENNNLVFYYDINNSENEINENKIDDIIEKKHRYPEGTIYGLYNADDLDQEVLYIGSAVNFERRMKRHENSILSGTSKCYRELRNIGWDNVLKLVLETIPCNHKNELRIIEQEYITLYNPPLNGKKENLEHLIFSDEFHNREKGLIYKIIDLKRLGDDGEYYIIYIGSTISGISSRIQQHKDDNKTIGELLKNKKDKKKLQKIYVEINKLGWNNIDFYVMEKFNCENDLLLKNRENKYITEYKKYYDLLNVSCPRYDDDGIDCIDLNIHHDEIENKSYRCDCGGKFKQNGTSTHIETKRHLKYLKNILKFNPSNLLLELEIQNIEENIIGFACDCGGKFRSKQHLAAHQKTKKHEKLMGEINRRKT